MKRAALTIALGLTLALAGCASGTSAGANAAGPVPQSASSQQASAQSPATPSEQKPDDAADGVQEAEESTESTLKLRIGGTDVAVEWEDNEAVAELAEMVADGPLTIQMSMYGGWEQVGPIGAGLTSEDEQITAQAGDIMLYTGNQIVVFYGSNSWAYTRLGRITDRTVDEMAELLGNGDVELTITAG